MSAGNIWKLCSRAALAIVGITAIATATQAWSQSGGAYVVQKAVVGSGGAANSSGGTFSVAGTTGQSIAGQKAASGTFSGHAGFWSPDELMPTAEHVVLSGRVMYSTGAGVQNIRVMMAMPDGSTRSAVSNSFGYFHFDDVEVGLTYLFTVSSRKYTFQQTMLVRGVLSTIDDLNFIALN